MLRQNRFVIFQFLREYLEHNIWYEKLTSAQKYLLVKTQCKFSQCKSVDWFLYGTRFY